MSSRLFIGGALIAAVAFIAPAKPSHADVKAFVDGIGGAKCSRITTDIKTNADIVANSVAHWAYGYMTRRNYEQARDGRSQVDLTKNFDGNKMLGVILGACEKNPDIYVFQVVDALYELLLKEQAPTV